MEKKKIRNYQIFSAIFVALLGTLLHFTYKLSGDNKIVAVFSSVNESTWEHLKLIYFPMLLSIILGYFYIGKKISNYICSKIIGIIVAVWFTIVFFYTYTGILGKNVAFIDISSFVIAVILGEFISYVLMINKYKCNNKLEIIVLIVLFICFVLFTFYTPKIGLFKDPVTKQYGIRKVASQSYGSR